MIAAETHRSGGRKEAHVRGWIVSVLLHGTVVLAATSIVKQIQLTPQNEPFKWNVAMVSPAQPVIPAAAPPNQAPAPAVSSTTPVPSPPMQQTAAAQPPQPFVQQTTPSISERPLTQVIPDPPVPSPPQQTTPSQPAAHPIQPAEPIGHETVAPRTAEATPIQKPAEAPMAAPAKLDAQTVPSNAPDAIHKQTAPSATASAPTQMASIPPAPSNAPSAIFEQTAQPETAPAQAQMAAIPPAPSNAPAKRDYGWLSEAILRRVEELKRYPASARVDRAEGKVVVKAVINEDGSIGEVEVFQSSGHPGLDKAAVETMRQAAPFHLPRPLGQPRMTIKIPMSYRLDR